MYSARSVVRNKPFSFRILLAARTVTCIRIDWYAQEESTMPYHICSICNLPLAILETLKAVSTTCGERSVNSLYRIPDGSDLQLGHVFCRPCIEAHIAKKSEPGCPVCGLSPVSPDHLVSLYVSHDEDETDQVIRSQVER